MSLEKSLTMHGNLVIQVLISVCLSTFTSVGSWVCFHLYFNSLHLIDLPEDVMSSWGVNKEGDVIQHACR